MTTAGASGRVLVVLNTNLSSCLNGTDSGASSVGPGSGAVPALGVPLSTVLLGCWVRGAGLLWDGHPAAGSRFEQPGGCLVISSVF